jgi:hypothetical protein
LNKKKIKPESDGKEELRMEVPQVACENPAQDHCCDPVGGIPSAGGRVPSSWQMAQGIYQLI